MILHTLFPDVRAEIIRLLFFDPTRQYYGREIARTTTLALSTVQRELARLNKAGFVETRRTKYYRFFRANRKHSAFPALHQLVLKDRTERAFVSQHKTPRLSRRQRRRARPAPRSNIISGIGFGRNIF